MRASRRKNDQDRGGAGLLPILFFSWLGQALARALQEPDSWSQATEALRGLVDVIVLTPDQAGEALQIELRGNLAAMLGTTVQTKRSPDSDDLSLQEYLVAGAGFEPATFGL